MSVTFYVNPEENLMLSSFEGQIDNTDFIDCYRTLLLDERYNPEMDEVTDLTGSPDLNITMQDLREINELMYEKAADSLHEKKSALVALTAEPVGHVRMYQGLNHHHTSEDLNIFQTLPEALTWLQKSPEAIEDLDGWEKIVAR